MRAQIDAWEDKKQEELGISWSWGGNKGIKQILVVDDEVRIRTIYQNIFKMMEFKVFTTANTTDTCIVLAAEEIDVVILDINLREPNRGVLYPLIRTFCKKAKVIVASVYPVNEQMERIKDADGYFDKADDKDVLVKMVSSFLEPKEAK